MTENMRKFVELNKRHRVYYGNAVEEGIWYKLVGIEEPFLLKNEDILSNIGFVPDWGFEENEDNE